MFKRSDVVDGLLFLPAMLVLAGAVFLLFSIIIAAGWWLFFGWMWILTIWLPLPRSVGGALAVLLTAFTIYGLFWAFTERRRRTNPAVLTA